MASRSDRRTTPFVAGPLGTLPKLGDTEIWLVCAWAQRLQDNKIKIHSTACLDRAKADVAFSFPGIIGHPTYNSPCRLTLGCSCKWREMVGVLRRSASNFLNTGSVSRGGERVFSSARSYICNAEYLTLFDEQGMVEIIHCRADVARQQIERRA